MFLSLKASSRPHPAAMSWTISASPRPSRLSVNALNSSRVLCLNVKLMVAVLPPGTGISTSALKVGLGVRENLVAMVVPQKEESRLYGRLLGKKKDRANPAVKRHLRRVGANRVNWRSELEATSG